MADTEQVTMSARDYLAEQLGDAVAGDDADYIRDVGNALADVLDLQEELGFYAEDGVYVVTDGGVHKFRRADFAMNNSLTKIVALTDGWEIDQPATA